MGDGSKAAWKRLFISFRGCFFRIFKRELEASAKVSEAQLFTERFQEVEIREDTIVHKILKDKLDIKNRSDLPYSDFSGCLLVISGILANGKKILYRVAFTTTAECEEWLQDINHSRKYMSSFPQRSDKNLILDISQRMITGVSIRERMYHLNIYYRCFVGKEAISWIMSDQQCSKSEALEIGNKLIDLKIIHHVAHEHFLCDEYYFYRYDMGVLNDLIETRPARIDGAPGTGRSIGLLHEMNREVRNLSSEMANAGFNIETVRYDLGATSSDLERLKREHRALADAVSTLQIEVSNSRVKNRLLVAVIFSILGVIVGRLCCPWYNDSTGLDIRDATLLVSLVLGEVLFGLLNRLIDEIIVMYFRRTDIISSKRNGGSFNVQTLVSPSSPSSPTASRRRPRGASLGATSQLHVVDDDDEEEEEEQGGEGGHRDESDTVPLPEELYCRESASEDRGVCKTDLLGGIPHPSEWPNCPLLARRSPDMLPEHCTDEMKRNLLKPLRLHQLGPLKLSEIPLESDLFSGKMILVLSGLKDSPDDFFRSKRRTFEAIVQGRFKRPVPFASVYTGQIFDQPFLALPPVWICRTIMAVLSRIQPAVQMCLEGNNPYIISPLASTSKHIVVSRPGEEPELGAVLGRVEEDMSLVDQPTFTGLASSQRVNFLSKRSNLLKYSYDPDLVYTFDFYQHVLNMGTMKIDIGITSFDILKVIGQCPVQTMSVCWDPVEQPEPPKKIEYLYNVELFHERNFPAGFFDETQSDGDGSTSLSSSS